MKLTGPTELRRRQQQRRRQLSVASQSHELPIAAQSSKSFAHICVYIYVCATECRTNVIRRRRSDVRCASMQNVLFGNHTPGYTTAVCLKRCCNRRHSTLQCSGKETKRDRPFIAHNQKANSCVRIASWVD